MTSTDKPTPIITLTGDIVTFFQLQAVIKYFLSTNENFYPKNPVELSILNKYITFIEENKDIWWREKINKYIDINIESKIPQFKKIIDSKPLVKDNHGI